MPVLCYHSVQAAWESPLAVTPDQFAYQCEWLSRHHTVVDLDTAVRLMRRNGRLPGRTTALTFDDGFADNFDTALPLLRKHGLPATVFIVAATVRDGYPVDWVDDPPTFALRTLSPDQVREMSTCGVTIGSHTLQHRTQTELSEEECRRDLSESKDVLEDLVGSPIEYLAYPRGEHNATVRAAAAAAGYARSFALPTGPETVTPHSLPRVGVYRGNTATTFRIKTSSWYLPIRTSRIYSAASRPSASAPGAL